MAKKSPSTNGHPRGAIDRKAHYASPFGGLYDPIASNRLQQQMERVHNALLTRSTGIRSQAEGGRRDINEECDYPQTGELNIEKYAEHYDREALAARVVQCMSRETWQTHPAIFEVEESDEKTAFEQAWDDLGKTLLGDSWYEDEECNPVWEYLRRADELSGKGTYGIILLGIDDKKPLSEPIEGINEEGNYTLKKETKEEPKPADVDVGTTEIENILNSSCGAGEEGSPGFQQGNTCGRAVGFHREPQEDKRYKGIVPDLRPARTVEGQTPHLQKLNAAEASLRAQGRLNEDGTVSLYHVTFEDDWKSIKKYGLVPQDKPGGQEWSAEHSKYATYFHSDLGVAERDALEAADSGAIIVEARVPITYSTISRFLPDEDFNNDPNEGLNTLIQGGAVAFVGGVQASALKKRKIVHNGAIYNAVGDSPPPPDDEDTDTEIEVPDEGEDEQVEVKTKYRLLYLRVFSELELRISEFENDVTNPRFGRPKKYSITINNPRNTSEAGQGQPNQVIDVHWTRVIHVADNLDSSEIFGVPRMQPVFNRLLDLRKIYASSAEGFWKGAFPGISLETHPQLGGDVVIDQSSLKRQMYDYMNTLQRYIALSGMAAKSLAPNVVDPTQQIDVQVTAICIQLGIPKRIFMGSERGELASSQDDDTWEARKGARRKQYVIPRIIIPFVDRLIAIGCLPPPKSWRAEWEEKDTLSPVEEAQVLAQRTTAMVAYANGGENVMAPHDYLTREMGFTEEEATAIEEAQSEHQVVLDEEVAAQQERELEMQEAAPTPAAGDGPPKPPGVAGPPGVKIQNVSQCGAGEEGDPGFQEGNTCGVGSKTAEIYQQWKNVKPGTSVVVSVGDGLQRVKSVSERDEKGGFVVYFESGESFPISEFNLRSPSIPDFYKDFASQYEEVLNGPKVKNGTNLTLEGQQFPYDATKQWRASLNKGEQKLVDRWVGGSWRLIKDRIAEGIPNDNDLKMLAAMEKSPKYEGVMYRGMKINGEQEVLDRVRDLSNSVGKTYVDKAPASYSTSIKEGSDFAGKFQEYYDPQAATGVLMVVKSKTARPIMHGLDFIDQQEIVSMPGTQYKITAVHKHAVVNGKHQSMIVEMEEL